MWLTRFSGISVHAALFAVVHAWLFLWHGQWLVLGFDTGFYRRYLLEPLISIPHASVPGLDHTVILPRVFMDLVRLTGLPTDLVLYGSYWLAAALLLFSFWFWVKETFSRQVAFWAVLLVLLSPVYFYAYWFFLLKNFLALAMFFWLLVAIRKDWWAAVLLLSVCIPITHQSTTVIAGIILFVYAALSLWRRKRWQLIFLSWAILTTIYLFYHPTVAAKLAAPPRAVFLDWTNLVQTSWPLIGLAVVASILSYKKLLRQSDLISWLTVVAVFLALTLPYHERVFFFAIFPLSVMAALWITTWKKAWSALFVVSLLIFWIINIKDYEPYFSREEVRNLYALESLYDSDNVITPNFMAPWVHGYTKANVYAPGVFKDAYTPYDWELYWSHTDAGYDRDFLDSYPQPLYLYVPTSAQYYLPQVSCVTKISDSLYRYTCYNKPYAEAVGESY